VSGIDRIQNSGFRVQDSGFRIQDSGFRILGAETAIKLYAVSGDS
jgi:hypothetical protein